MNIFERTVFKHFLIVTGKLLLVFLSFTILIQLIDIFGDRSFWLQWDELLFSLQKYTFVVEIAFAVAFPLGIIITLNDLKKKGILISFLGAGLTIKSFRKIIIVAAFCTLMASVVAFEVNSLARTAWINGEEPVKLLKVGRTNVWCLKYKPALRTFQNVVLFNDDNLDVSRAQEGRWSSSKNIFQLSLAEPVVGSKILLEEFPLRKKRGDLLEPVSIKKWFTRQAGAAEIIVAANRIITGCILLLISAYLTLLISNSRHWIIYLSFLFLIPTIWIGMLYTSILAWSGEINSYIVEATWLIFLTLNIIVLDKYLQCRGIRIS